MILREKKIEDIYNGRVRVNINQEPHGIYRIEDMILIIFRPQHKVGYERKLCIFDFRKEVLFCLKKIAVDVDLDKLIKAFFDKEDLEDVCFYSLMHNIAQRPDVFIKVAGKKIFENIIFNNYDNIINVLNGKAHLQVYRCGMFREYSREGTSAKQKLSRKSADYIILTPADDSCRNVLSIQHFYGKIIFNELNFLKLFKKHIPIWEWKTIMEDNTEMIYAAITGGLNQVIINNDHLVRANSAVRTENLAA